MSTYLEASYIYQNYFVKRWVLRPGPWAGPVFLSINLISFKHSQNYHLKKKNFNLTTILRPCLVGVKIWKMKNSRKKIGEILDKHSVWLE